MGKRYYYTDPLAAAWMAKHFSMTFERSDGDLLLDFDDMADDLALHIASDHWDGIYFIHADSLHLLEPRAKDVVMQKDEDGYDAYNMLDEWDIEQKFADGCQIIGRDGKPFFWPECEE